MQELTSNNGAMPKRLRSTVLLCAAWATYSAHRVAMAGEVGLNLPTDPTAIVRRGEEKMRGRSIQALMSMRILRPSFTRDLQLRLTTEGTKNALVTILKPVKEEGITSLRLDTHMWNYLPKTDQTVRVPLSLMLQSWMGSDFTNDDLMKMSSLSEDYSHTALRFETLRGNRTVVIECRPKMGAAVVWGKILLWARTNDNLSVRQEYYDEQGKLVRTLDLDQFKRMDDRIIPVELTIRKADEPGESTTVVYEKILFDRRIDRSVFSSERLKETSQNGTDSTRGWLTETMGAALAGS